MGEPNPDSGGGPPIREVADPGKAGPGLSTPRARLGPGHAGGQPRCAGPDRRPGGDPAPTREVALAERLAADGHPAAARELPYRRACALESGRLWPTTLAVLRDTTTETSWDGGVLPQGTALVIVGSSSTATSGPCRTPTASSPRSGWTAAPWATAAHRALVSG
jgi:hypothetical protein